VSDLDSDFQAAVAAVDTLAADPGNQTKLALYGLYKQATRGDVEGGRPGFTNPVGRAKYDAWAARAGTTTDDAKRAYVALVADLRADGGRAPAG
jgi:diazepam-binding inhibitor (GABA receptor modulator, acyl-CoA-binding protein)